MLKLYSCLAQWMEMLTPPAEYELEAEQFNSCGNCNELPCKSFNELKDPNLSEEAHLEEVARRVERLKKPSAGK